MKVLITGASSGIGRACAKQLAAKGHTLILVARREERLELLRKELGDGVETAALDITDAQAVNHFFETHHNSLKEIDALVNNAGLALGMEPFQALSEEDILQMLQTNVTGLMRMTRKILPFMIAKKSGHVLNVGSVAGRSAYRGGTVYCATKAAVHMLTETLRLDLGGTGLRVSTLAPGRVAETEFSEVRFKGDLEKAKKVYEGFRVMTSSDVAEAMVWILERPSHINVQELVLLPTDQSSPTTLDPLR